MIFEIYNIAILAILVWVLAGQIIGVGMHGDIYLYTISDYKLRLVTDLYRIKWWRSFTGQESK